MGRPDAGCGRCRTSISSRSLNFVRFVIDANVYVQMSLTGGVLAPLAGHDLIAPPIFGSEVTASLCELTYRGEVPVEVARRIVDDLARPVVSIQQPADIYVRAWDLARSLGWAKSYDAEYLALALILEIPLVTIDARLRRGAGHIVAMPTLAEVPKA